MWIFFQSVKLQYNNGTAGSSSYEIFVKITIRLWLGIGNLVPAGADTVSVWHEPCQHWWQLGLTSSQDQPKSYTASVTSSVCGEFVMGDWFSGDINRHRFPPSQWRYKLSLMQIFTEHTKEIHFLSHRPPTDTSQKLERLALPRRGSVQEGEKDRQTWPPSSAQLCFAVAGGSCQHKLLQRHW